MNRSTRWALLLILVVCPPLTGQTTSLDKLLEYRNLNSIDVSPDGSRAVLVVMESNLKENRSSPSVWQVDLASGEAGVLIKGEGHVADPSWSPDGKRIAYLFRGQIWTILASGGEAAPAARFPRVRIREFRWLPDGRGFVFAAQDPPTGAMGQRPGGGGPPMRQPAARNPQGPPRRQNRPLVMDRDVRYSRIYRFVEGDQRPERLTKEDYHVGGFDISPDEKKLVLSGQARPGGAHRKETDLRILDLQTGKFQALASGLHLLASPRFSPDGSWIAFTAGEGDRRAGGHVFGEIGFLWIVRPDGSGLRQLTKPLDANIRGFEWAADSQAIFFQAFRGVSMKAFRLALVSGQFGALGAFPGPGVCQAISFGADARTGAAIFTDASTPLEVYRLEGAGAAARKLTAINSAFAGMATETEVMKYRSDDGWDLEALVYKPKNYREGKRYPLLVLVHGGPAGVFRYMFAPRHGAYPTFAFLEQGYVLLLPNPRGSLGYGEAFRRANIGDLGGGDYRDIMAGVDLLIDKGVADPERMGLMGWSYGGQMGYWVATHTDRFKAISAGAGITNLFSHYSTGQARGYGQHDGIWGAPPWENPQIYLDHSPLMFVGNAKTPILIQHGELDPIVPVTQAHEFYWAAKRVGLEVEMVIYPGQGHPIQEPRLALDALQRNLDWFHKHVGVD